MWQIEAKQGSQLPASRKVLAGVVIVALIGIIGGTAWLAFAANVKGELVADGGAYPGFSFPASWCHRMGGKPIGSEAEIVSSTRPEFLVWIKSGQMQLFYSPRDPGDPDVDKRWEGIHLTIVPEGAKPDPAAPAKVVPCANFRSSVIGRHTWFYRFFRKANWRRSAEYPTEYESVFDVELDCPTPQLGRIHGRFSSDNCR